MERDIEGGDPGEGDDLAARLARLEERVARLERTDPASQVEGAGTEAEPGDVFWALRGLKERAGDAVLFTGNVTLPGGEHYEWQQGHRSAELLDDDWSQAADALSALAHPVRLMLLREILNGAHGSAELAADERLGTTGQLYHHLRQLVAAGWLRTTARGRYAVPGERVVPILTILAATRR